MRIRCFLIPALMLTACLAFPSFAQNAATTAAGAASVATNPATPDWRPALHYTPARHWMNDPNGLVYYRGVWHLFYQYNPHGNDWGNMSWGHATSTDLLHWTEQPVAMPSTPAEDIFSGSIVVDERNTSGLGTPEAPALVALYTSVFKPGSGHAPGVQAQSLAYSTDGGFTWRKYARNPVLTLQPESRQFRDPKVRWYAPGGYWLMTAVVADAHVVKLYRSRNLIDWEFLSDFGPAGVAKPGVLWEMPDLFPLPLDGDAADPRWVMVVNINPWSIAGGSGAQYFVGRFDGTRFVAEHLAPMDADPSHFFWLDHGADYYAAGTFANAPDGKTVMLAWMGNWDYADRVPTFPWRGAMTLPRELRLRTIEGVPQLVFAPVESYGALVRSRAAAQAGTLTVSSSMRSLGEAARGEVQDIQVTIEPRTSRRAGLVVRGGAAGHTGTRIVYDREAGTLTVDRSRSGRTDFSPKFSPAHIARIPLIDGRLRLRVVVDRGSIEVFAGDGRLVFTELIFPAAGDDRVSVFAEAGEAVFEDLAITRLAP